MRHQLFAFLFLFPSIIFSQTSHYDSLYNQGLISKADWQLLRSTYAKPVDSTAIKIASYDSLYSHGLISKNDRDVLVRQSLGEKGVWAEKDTLNDMIDYYDGLFRDHKMSVRDHQLAIDETRARYKPLNHPVAPRPFNPKEARELAGTQTTAGIVCMVIADAFMGVAIGRAIKNPDNAGDVANGLCIGGTVVFRILGIGLLSHGGVLRHRADRYERDQMLMRR